jgi:tetratricopeptide (TPR) repeat protein
MRFILFFLLSILFLSCSSNDRGFNSLPEGVQTVSLLGDTLKTNSAIPLPESLTNRLDSLITLAEESGAPTEALIWNARQLGYNGEYRKAISLLTEGIANDPENPALYRHRGHRYISLRAFSAAIKDFEKAATLIKGKTDIVEQDG